MKVRKGDAVEYITQIDAKTRTLAAYQPQYRRVMWVHNARETNAEEIALARGKSRVKSNARKYANVYVKCEKRR